MGTNSDGKPHLRIVIAWAVVLLGTFLLAVRYPDLPANFPVYRNANGTAAQLAPKSVVVVFRVALMGAGQLGATTAMLLNAARTPPAGWVRFWSYASYAAAAKTLVECIQCATLGIQAAERLGVWWVALTVAPVVVFLVLAARLWRTRQLDQTDRMSGWAWIAVTVSLSVWFGFAYFPKWAV